MTKEEAKSKASIRIQLFDAKGANKIIDQIYNDHKAQLKTKDEEIKELGEIVQQYLIPSKNYDAIIKAKDEEIERLKAESKQAYIEGSKSCDDLIRFYITKIEELSK